MIGKLKGLVDSVGDDFAIIDVQGVGYVVNCSGKTLSGLPEIGLAVSLAIETQVREDAIRLYGFRSDLERDWFRILLTVQGVGSKVALAILTVLAPGDLANAIALQDKASVARAPGVGPKLAARIVAELKDKTPAYINIDAGAVKLAGDVIEKRAPQPLQDAVSALVNLGYGQPQASAAVAAAAKALGDNPETAALIRRGLKELSS
ncbi:MAG: Holliday junction branch migration protein RuvA [Beijerinckiaceae bacterium]|nr:Holliday junction branch migration protein RuvA [Beijerinckiaceae bacterium]